MLTQCGARRVLCLKDGTHVAEKLADEPFDLVIVDCEVEQCDGIDLLWRLRSDGQTRRIPVLMTVALATAARIRDVRDAGVDEILLKPVTVRGLVAKANDAVLRRRRFLETPNYIGPDRRRGTTQGYNGPLRRASDVKRNTPSD